MAPAKPHRPPPTPPSPPPPQRDVPLSSFRFPTATATGRGGAKKTQAGRRCGNTSSVGGGGDRPRGHPNGRAGAGGGASPARPGRAPAPGRAEHQRRRGVLGARAARPPRAPLLPPGGAHTGLPHQRAPEAQAGGSVDEKTGPVRSLRQRGDPGRLPDAPEEPHRGAQVAARLAGERAAEVYPQKAGGGRSDVCRGLPQAQQEDPVLVQALQSYWEAPLGATVASACGAVVLWRCDQNKNSFHTVGFQVLSATLAVHFWPSPEVLLLLQA